MNTCREIVSQLKGILAARGVVTDESDWQERLFLHYINRARSAVLKARLDDKRSRVSHWNKQTITCVPLEKVDLNACPCVPNSGCYFLKSIAPIPEPVSRYLQIDNVIGNKEIDYVEWGEFRNKLKSRYERERKGPYWTLRNLGDGTYLYLYNFTEKFATVTSIFESPLEVFLYPNCEGVIEKRCEQYLDFPFVIDDGYIPLVLEASYKMLAEKVKVSDKLINQSDDTGSSRVPLK